jgi:hypothetical protein
MNRNSNLQKRIFVDESESEIQSKIVEVLKIKKYLVVRINSGMRAIGKRLVRFYQIMNNGATAGFPDLIAIKNNKILMVEVKSKTGKLREAQKDFISLAAKFGNSILVTDSWEEVLNYVEQKSD